MRELLLLGLLGAAACGADDGPTSSAGGGGDGPASTPASSSHHASSSSGHGGHATSTTGAGGAGGAGGAPPQGKPYVYVGSSDGKIRVYTLDRASGAVALQDTTDAGSNPSFLAFTRDRRFVYAVDENANAVLAFAVDGATGKLTALGSPASSGGSGPAHVAVDGTGKWVFATNYGSGDVTVIATNGDGSLGAQADHRATGANAHELVLDEAGAFAFVPDKGADRVSQLLFDATSGHLAPNAAGDLSFPAGSGPRHVAFHPHAAFAYVIDETDSAMVALAYDAAHGTLTRLQALSTLPAGVDGTNNTGAEVAIDAAGRFLYGSNRGHDSIVVFSIDGAGMMTRVSEASTSGATPRHFSLDPGGPLLLAGDQGSNRVVSFTRDPATGELTQLMTTDVPAPPEYVGVILLDP